jgi:cell division protein FtsQ
VTEVPTARHPGAGTLEDPPSDGAVSDGPVSEGPLSEDPVSEVPARTRTGAKGTAPGPDSGPPPAAVSTPAPVTEVAPDDEATGGGGDPDEAVHPRLWQRRMAVLREQGHRRMRWVVAGVAVLVVLCVVLLVLHTPLLALRNATVRGAQHTGDQTVLSAAGLLADPPLIDVDPAATAAKIEKLPWVAHAVVVRHWPDSVTITVTERVPLGSVPMPGGGAAVVDASGRVLAWETSAPPGLVLVAPVSPGRPGTILAPGARPALEVAAALPPSLAARVLHVIADAHGVVTLDLGRRVTAALGTADGIGAKLTALASVLAGAQVSGPAVIDVTVPDEPTVGPPPPRSGP